MKLNFILFFEGHMMYLENVYGDGFDQPRSRFASNYFGTTSARLSIFYNVDVKASDIEDYIKHQPDSYFNDEIKLTRGRGAFGRLF